MQEAVSTREVTGSASAGGGRARAVYVLYLVGLVFWPVAIVGVAVAYLDRVLEEEAPGHRRFQIRTVGIGVFQWVIGFAVLALAIGLNRIAFIFGLLPLLSPVAGLLPLLWFQQLVWMGPVPAVAFQNMTWWLLVLLTALLVWGLFWWTKRCLGGLRCLARQESYPNPGTWLW